MCRRPGSFLRLDILHHDRARSSSSAGESNVTNRRPFFKHRLRAFDGRARRPAAARLALRRACVKNGNGGRRRPLRPRARRADREGTAARGPHASPHPRRVRGPGAHRRPGRLLRRAIQADQLSSLIFYGPPGTGKTTLAQVIANTTKSHFITMNAVLAGVKEIRESIEEAQTSRGSSTASARPCSSTRCTAGTRRSRTRSCRGWRTAPSILIGATTENPYFEVNRALVSRSRDLPAHGRSRRTTCARIARAALADAERGYGALPGRASTRTRWTTWSTSPTATRAAC